MAKSLKETKSLENLKAAFAGEAQANRRYLYFARQADIEGYADIGGLFRDTAEAETGSTIIVHPRSLPPAYEHVRRQGPHTGRPRKVPAGAPSR